MTRLIAQWHAYVERERLQPDLNRAARCTVGFMAPLLAVLWWHLPIAAFFAALAAQSITLVDVRGSYPLRLSLLLAMTAVLAGSTWLGSTAASHLALALAAVVVVTLAGGLWRHLSVEYGPSLAISSSLILLIALAYPGGPAGPSRYFLSALAGGLWGVAVQVFLWPFRAQHPLRRNVGDAWLALSDLLEAMNPEDGREAASRPALILEREALLRTAQDNATESLAAALARHQRPHLRQLEEMNTAAARLATRCLAFHTALEMLRERPGGAALEAGFAPVLRTLVNTTRSIALTVVSRQPSHLAAVEVRLRRLDNLLRAMADRVRLQTGRDPAGEQVNFILEQIGGQLPLLGAALRATVARAGEHSAFSLELFDLQTWTLRPLASALNPQWRPDATLVRFIARAVVLQTLGVAVFEYFHLERGYWLPLTTLVVLQPDYGATHKRAGQRVLGTIIGGVLASLLLYLALPAAALLAFTAVTMAGYGFWQKRNYTVAVFFITLFVVLLTEASEKVTLFFTVERLAATAAGGLLALAAALLFWPLWERQRFPALLAGALRANREYLRLLAVRLADGGGYDAPVIQAKRAAEAANNVVFSSLQRMGGDPKNQRQDLEESAALANGNQRLTRAFTVVGLHLTPGTPLSRPDMAAFAATAGEALEKLAATVETAPSPDGPALAALRAGLDAQVLQEPSNPTPLEHSVNGQFARCVTELSAMLLLAQPA